MNASDMLPPVDIVTIDNIVIAPQRDAGTVFLIKSVPRIGESIRVEGKRYRIKDIEHTLDHPQGHQLTLVVELDREIGEKGKTSVVDVKY
jgi:hypothetical protein